MRAAIHSQHVVIKVFDTEAQAGDADLLERFELRFLQRTRLALEGHLLRVGPTHMGVEAVNQIMQLLFADVRRRAAAEVNEA